MRDTLGKNIPLRALANVKIKPSIVIAMPSIAIDAEPDKAPRMLGAILKMHLCANAIIVTQPE